MIIPCTASTGKCNKECQFNKDGYTIETCPLRPELIDKFLEQEEREEE